MSSRMECLPRWARVATAASILAIAAPGLAPAAQQTPSSSAPTTAAVVSAEEDYRIGAADVLEVAVEDAPELSKTFRVSTAGTIAMPFVGTLEVKDRTPEEVAERIAGNLRGRYLVDPKVAVTVKQINSRSFFIQGAVQRPGLYQIEGKPSLLKLITVAGGLKDSYGSTAFIIREAKRAEEPRGAGEAAPDAEYEMIKASIGGLLRGGFEQNVRIEPGDIVHIPPADVFFVAGEVRAPGSFPLKEGTTLRQAITLAQGTTFKAAADRGIIFRENEKTGKREEIKVDISAVMSGKKEDLSILPNDIVIIPNSKLKSVTAPILSAFGVNAARLPIPF